MAGKFIIRVGHETFEPIKKNGHVLAPVADGSYFRDIEKLLDLHMNFAGYITDGDEYVGIKLVCNLGYGYGFDYGEEEVELRVGDTHQFSFSGTSVDDEGDPEEFSIYYHLQLYAWDPDLLDGPKDK